ncbi:helicase-related protein [Paenibacillus urinalis]|uniref:Helicase-related protein n=1 Tax=Paenibacillus urinalis TaxID=521520 RepID=A0ABY7XAT8_9BACL|nr:helicase-related protein [Paenibacillus urinalis]WDH98292.1 helicase-related protein [Paenibacillus urinalis]WDI01979.1 helicase-related protein [Paenibacillus urinalis]
MRIGLYAIRLCAGSGNGREWRIFLSLHLSVDWLWWREQLREASPAGVWQVVMISEAMPLSWAYRVQAGLFKDGTRTLGSGGAERTEVQWREMVKSLLAPLISAEPGEQGERMFRECVEIREFQIGHSGLEEWGEQKLGIVGDLAKGQKTKLEDELYRERGCTECAGLTVSTVAGKAMLRPGGRSRMEMDGMLYEHCLSTETAAHGSVETRRSELRNNSHTMEVGPYRVVASTEHGDQRRAGSQRFNSVDEIYQLRVKAERVAQQLAGRQLLMPEAEALLAEIAPEVGCEWQAAVQLAYLAGRVRYRPTLASPQAARSARFVWPWVRREQLRCRRCGSMAAQQSACAACGSAACAYCEACLALGRSRSCALLLEGAALPAVRGTAGGSPTDLVSRWGLSPAQSAATGAALAYLARRREDARAKGRFLLWAVTGAGKTEMTYPLLDYILASGGSVLVATPRRDVVLELAPRVARAFPDTARVTLYGGSSERWQRGQLTLATTHQLLRFRHAFDLVILDELDAFPYHNDPMLAYAAEACCKPGGSFIYLSATPPAQLQREAARGKLAHARVPVRFHRHPLPVPVYMKLPYVAQQIKQRKLPRELQLMLKRSLERGAQVFLFVTRISQIESFVALLRASLPGIRVEGTSSEDPLRGEKVMSFRDREIRLLVTTTILERGVTVPKSDVYILDANTRLFDDASLVQMAGRAGRSKDDPAGTVIFGAPEVNRAQKVAVRQIKRMNAIARRNGYLVD